MKVIHNKTKALAAYKALMQRHLNSDLCAKRYGMACGVYLQ